MISGRVSVLKQWLQLWHMDSRKFWVWKWIYRPGLEYPSWSDSQDEAKSHNIYMFQGKTIKLHDSYFLHSGRPWINFIKNQECASNTVGLKLKLKLNLVWLKMPSLFHVWAFLILYSCWNQLIKTQWSSWIFKGCVNLFFKITWVATFIQKRTHCAKIVACPPCFIFCKFDVTF
jgi:hypothetical protein